MSALRRRSRRRDLHLGCRARDRRRGAEEALAQLARRPSAQAPGGHLSEHPRGGGRRLAARPQAHVGGHVRAGRLWRDLSVHCDVLLHAGRPADPAGARIGGAARGGLDCRGAGKRSGGCVAGVEWPAAGDEARFGHGCRCGPCHKTRHTRSHHACRIPADEVRHARIDGARCVAGSEAGGSRCRRSGDYGCSCRPCYKTRCARTRGHRSCCGPGGETLRLRIDGARRVACSEACGSRCQRSGDHGCSCRPCYKTRCARTRGHRSRCGPGGETLRLRIDGPRCVAGGEACGSRCRRSGDYGCGCGPCYKTRCARTRGHRSCCGPGGEGLRLRIDGPRCVAGGEACGSRCRRPRDHGCGSGPRFKPRGARTRGHRCCCVACDKGSHTRDPETRHDHPRCVPGNEALTGPHTRDYARCGRPRHEAGRAHNCRADQIGSDEVRATGRAHRSRFARRL